MEKQLIGTGHTWEKEYPYRVPPRWGPERKPMWTQVAKVNMKGANLIFIAGQTGMDDLGRIVVPGDTETQAQLLYENIKDCLKAAGATAADIVYERANVGKDHMQAWRTVGSEARRKFYAEAGVTQYPPYTSIGVDRLAIDGVVIEVEVIAVTSAE